MVQIQLKRFASVVAVHNEADEGVREVGTDVWCLASFWQLMFKIKRVKSNERASKYAITFSIKFAMNQLTNHSDNRIVLSFRFPSAF